MIYRSRQIALSILLWIVDLTHRQTHPGERCLLVVLALGDHPALYVTHYSLIYLQMAWAANHKEAPLETHVFVAVSLFLLALSIAWATYKLYDVPIREWLKKKCFARK